MELLEAMKRRHSVRQYTDRPIPAEVLAELEAEAAACSREGSLHIQPVTDEPDAFQGILAHYGKFSGVRNYLALAGPKGPDLDEKLGYYGERLVLRAAQLGLDSCWVALTFRKGKCRCTVAPGGETGLRGGTGLWRDARRSPQEQAHGGPVPGGRRDARLVPRRDGGSASGSHRHQSAEVPADAGGERG